MNNPEIINFTNIAIDNIRTNNIDLSNRFYMANAFFRSLVARYVKTTGHEIIQNRALDFGCGFGKVSQSLSPLFNCVVGMDVSDKAISLANELNKFPLKCTYIHINSEKIPCENELFDLVICFNVIPLMELNLADICIRECIRVLNSLGVLIFNNKVEKSEKEKKIIKKSNTLDYPVYPIPKLIRDNENLLGDISKYAVQKISDMQIISIVSKYGGKIELKAVQDAEITKKSKENQVGYDYIYFVSKRNISS